MRQGKSKDSNVNYSGTKPSHAIRLINVQALLSNSPNQAPAKLRHIYVNTTISIKLKSQKTWDPLTKCSIKNSTQKFLYKLCLLSQDGRVEDVKRASQRQSKALRAIIKHIVPGKAGYSTRSSMSNTRIRVSMKRKWKLESVWCWGFFLRNFSAAVARSETSKKKASLERE